MAENSKIEWTDHTFNPWIGCTKVSPGCQHCYAEQLMDLRYGKVQWGPSGTRVRTSESNWRLPLKWDRQAKEAGVRHRVFCASLADVFEDRPELVEWRQWLIHLIDATQNLDWLLLTKRPENVMRMWPSIEDAPISRVATVKRNNVWIGTSVENQKCANDRIPHLLRIPAKVRFLSIEPLLGPVDVAKWFGPQNEGQWMNVVECGHASSCYGVNWVIVGGESGPGARPMHPDWVRSIRDQCVNAGVPFFFKQWGEWLPVYDRDVEDPDWRRCDEVKRQTPRGEWLNIAGGSGFHGDRLIRMNRAGKAKSGRLLDGREWSEMPGVDVQT